MAVGALLFGEAGTAVGQDSNRFQQLFSVDLTQGVDRIYPAGPDNVLATVSRSDEITLIEVKTGKARGRMNFDGEVTEVLPKRIDNYTWQFAILVRSHGDVGIERYSVRLIEVRFGELLEIQNLRGVIPSEFRDPGIAFVFMNSKADTYILTWDRSAISRNRRYKIFSLSLGSAPVEGETFVKYPPFQFLNVGSSNFVLVLNSRDDGASLIDLQVGIARDDIFIGGLLVDDPSQLSVFVPDAPGGGTGDVIVANAEMEILSIITINYARRPRIAPPTQISLKALGGFFKGRRRLLVASDREVNFILVGAVGSGVVALIRKIGGGLERAAPILLDNPVRDIAVLRGGRDDDAENFVFLHADGVSLSWSTEVSGLSPTARSDGSDLIRYHFSSVPHIGVELMRVQRVLAALGYPVGAIDGLPGASTTAAISAFQIQRGLQPSGYIDRAMLIPLNAAVEEIARANGADATYFEDYRTFVGKEVPGDVADRLLILGASHGNPENLCFGLNSVPPRELWVNSLGFAKILRSLEDDKDLIVKIISGYRNANYGRCAAGPDVGSHHLNFEAFDITASDGHGRRLEPGELAQILREMRQGGLFRGAIGIVGAAVHVDTRGVDVEFGQP